MTRRASSDPVFSSSALVDYSGLAKTVNDLQGRFSILEFLDFCSLVEGVILHDRLVVVGNPEPLRGGFADALKPFFEAGVLTAPRRAKPLPLPPLSDPHPSIRLQDAWYEAGRLLGAELEFGISALALLRQRPVYETYGRVREQHSICDLVGHYQRLSDAVAAIRSQTRLPLQNYIEVPVPPIPLLILQRSARVDDLVVSALELRHDYRELRISLSYLREELADFNIPPNKKAQQIRSWERSWSTLAKYDEARQYGVELATTTLDSLDVSQSLDGLSIESISISGLLQRVLTLGAKTFYSWRVRLLHKAARNYLATADGAVASEVERVFGRPLTSQDVRDLHSLRGEDELPYNPADRADGYRAIARPRRSSA